MSGTVFPERINLGWKAHSKCRWHYLMGLVGKVEVKQATCSLLPGLPSSEKLSPFPAVVDYVLSDGNCK